MQFKRLNLRRRKQDPDDQSLRAVVKVIERSKCDRIWENPACSEFYEILGVVELVAQRDAATLLPIIQQHVRPGTIVWSDMWTANNVPPVAQH